jgi:hypothetical protein
MTKIQNATIRRLKKISLSAFIAAFFLLSEDSSGPAQELARRSRIAASPEVDHPEAATLVRRHRERVRLVRCPS